MNSISANSSKAKKIRRGRKKRPLSKKHAHDLKQSGLSDGMIAQCGFYTERNLKHVGQKLNWSPSDTLENMGPFLALPYFGLDGQPTDYVRFKPDHPRRSTDRRTGKKKPVKYEGPKGKPTCPYFPPPAIPDILDSAAPLIITEGEKKAAKATQEGFPCIGLPGVSNWSAPSKQASAVKKDRELHEMLAVIPWQGRRVMIMFDADELHNPNVNREAADLARVLEQHGAVVTIVNLPPVWNDTEQRFEKQGLDDYLVEHTAADLAHLIHEASSEKRTVSLDEYRRLMLEKYEQLEHDGRYYVNRAPTGMGKTYTDIARSRAEESSLFMVPTRRQEYDLIWTGYNVGLCISNYPVRSCENCEQFEQIEIVQDSGFNPGEIVCPKCVRAAEFP